MPKRWLILVLLAGTLAAAVVWIWPQGPRWRSGPDAGQVLWFSPDSRTVITSRMLSSLVGASPEVCRWDAATGELLSRAEMLCAQPDTVKKVWPSGDGRLALVGEDGMPNMGREDFQTGRLYLHDGVTGQRRSGQIPGVASAFYQPFSPDGRWFVAQRGHPDDGRKTLKDRDGLDIFSAATGERIISLQDQEGWGLGECCFAPDGKTAAVSELPRDYQRGDTRLRIRVVELPSGRLRHRFELPSLPWLRIHKWDGQRLEGIVRKLAEPPGKPAYQICVFDLTQLPVGDGVENPLLYARLDIPEGVDHWFDGSGCLAYCRIVSPPSQTSWYGWTQEWLRQKIHATPDRGLARMSVRIVDRATGATRYELPYPVPLPGRISPDGRLFACRTDADGVEVWDIDPPRWPWALAAGAGAALVPLAIGRWRQRRRVAVPAGKDL